MGRLFQEHDSVWGDERVFFANGMCAYVDSGMHPEVCTPECTHPAHLVKHILAGDRMLKNAGDKLAKSLGGLVANVNKTNVDPESGYSWGCHESYQHKCDFYSFERGLIPHLITRIIYTGAGGWSCGGDFTLSPRSLHITTSLSDSSQSRRPILHTKQERLDSTSLGRLHLIVGESLCSQTAMFLKYGTTALIIMMMDNGVDVWPFGMVNNPVTRLHDIAQDITCKDVKISLRCGKRINAIQAQRHYLSLAKKYEFEKWMPPWAGEVIWLWQHVLDRLNNGAPDSVATVLDWAMKWKLIDRKPYSPRQKMEADIRFGEIGKNGVFNKLDAAGILHHKVPGIEPIDWAMDNPPPFGRAKLRGDTIKIARNRSDAYISTRTDGCGCASCRRIRRQRQCKHTAHWSYVTIYGKRIREHEVEAMTLRMSDPFGNSVVWEDQKGVVHGFDKVNAATVFL